jgi:hypothetical protein
MYQLPVMGNALLNVKFTTNRRGDHNLAFDLYTYKIFWKCVVVGCSANISTKNNISVGFGTKSHTPCRSQGSGCKTV